MMKKKEKEKMPELQAIIINNTKKLFNNSKDPDVINECLKQTADILRINKPLEEYSEIHQTCISFFGSLLQVMKKMKRSDLECIFNKVLTTNKIVPRLYEGFTVACALEDMEKIDFISKMFPCVANPILGFMLRFFSISFIPENLDIHFLKQFAKENFKEMLLLLNKFNLSQQETMCSQLSPNIQFAVKNEIADRETVDFFIKSSLETPNPYVALNIIDSLVQSIQPEKLIEYFDSFNKFFMKFNENNKDEIFQIKISNTALLCWKKCRSHKAFSFISNESFVLELCTKIIETAIQSNDMHALKETIQLCPDNLVKKILKSIGPEEFSKIAPKNLSFSTKIAFLNMINPLTSPESVQKIIISESTGDRKQFFKKLCELVKNPTYSSNYIQNIFGDDYIFDDSKLLKLYMEKINSDHKMSYLLSILDKHKNIDIQTKMEIICKIWENRKGKRRLFFKYISFSECSQSTLCKILKILHNVNPKEETIQQIFSLCKCLDSNIEFFKFIINYESMEDNLNLLQQNSFEALIMYDNQIVEFNEKIDFYFKILKIISDSNNTKLKINLFLPKMINNIISILKFAKENSRFQIAEEEKKKMWKEIVQDIIKNNDIFKDYKISLEQIEFLLTQISFNTN